MIGINRWTTHSIVFALTLFGLSLISPYAFAGGGACPANLPVTGNNCYFIAATGSDTNNGTSESTPWLHAPGMPNCTGNCASALSCSGYSCSAAQGKGFIFRGGDTWHFGNSSASPYTGGTWAWNWPGDTSGATCVYEGNTTGCAYIGVDKSWYSGSSWARPIMSGDNPTSTSAVSSCAYQIGSSDNLITFANIPWTYLDNLEFTGMCVQPPGGSANSTSVYVGGFNTGTAGYGISFYYNLYIHGWTVTSSLVSAGDYGCTALGGGNQGLQAIVGLVVDGSDSDPAHCSWGIYPSWYHMKDSMIRYTTDGVGQWCHDIHDNIFEFIVPIVPSGHTNILECNADNSGNAPSPGIPQNTPNVVYNNIVRHSNSNVMLWFCPDVVPEYWFNNLMYDSVGEGWSYAGPPTYGCPNTGGQYMFNNTFVDGNLGGWNQPCYMDGYVGHGGQYLTVYNEHLINTSFDTGTTSCTGASSSTNVAMSDAAANSQGYTTGSPGTYVSNTCANEGTTPCAPTASTNSTVATGANYQSYCTVLASYSSEYAIGTEAATACQYGTTDACSYNATTHTMNCPAQTAVARPSTGAWDAGSYQYASTRPQPPTNLQATPH
jgi:hypothetical protein